MKGTVLVSGASGIVGYGILRSLTKSGYRLIGTTIYDVSPANCFSDIVEKAPLTDSGEYLPWLLDMIKKYNISMIIPGIEADISLWNKNRKIISRTGCFVQLNNPELIDLCLDKWMFYEKLKNSGIKCLIDSTLEKDYERFDKPFIIKPRCGFGSRGIVKISNRKEYNNYCHLIGTSHMAQEYIDADSEEYTIATFFDRNSELKAMISMRRILSKVGYTEQAEVVDIDEIKEVILEIASILKPCGPTNFQFRRNEAGWKLLEINPRISSSTSIRTKFGYNESQMCIDYFLENREIVQPLIRMGRAIRYTEDFIV